MLQTSILPWTVIDSFAGNTNSPTLTEYRPCPICESIHSQTLLTMDDFQFFTDSATIPKRAQIRQVQCKNCQALYLNPSYTAIGFRYLFAEAGQSYGSTAGRPHEQIDWLTRMGLLGKATVFLDAGCYDGRFLSFLPRHTRRIGVDIDAPAIRRGKKNYGDEGVEFIHGAFEDFECPVKPDVISMFHVLEHLCNPFEVLRHLCSISHSGTRLVIEVPVLENGKTNDITGFFSVQHMTHFSMCSLGALFTRSGWEVIESEQMQGYNGYRVVAKPAKTCEKANGDSADRAKTYEYMADWYQELSSIAHKIESLPASDKIIIWGGGMHSEFLYHVTPLFQQVPHRQYVIVDSDPSKQGKSWRGVPILSPEILKGYAWENTFLLISSYGGQNDIAAVATQLGVPTALVKKLYEHVNAY